MTADEWDRSADPAKMLEWLNKLGKMRPDFPSDRKGRLFVCAVARQLWGGLCSVGHRAVEVGECYADGLADEEDRHVALREISERRQEARRGSIGEHARCYVAHACVGDDPVLVWMTTGNNDYWRDLHGYKILSDEVQANLLRDIADNPFRNAILFDHRWLTPTVSDLALAAYRDRPGEDGTLDPIRLAVLRDALLDAGCNEEPILEHLSEGTHIRGCWVLDLLLDKK